MNIFVSSSSYFQYIYRYPKQEQEQQEPAADTPEAPSVELIEQTQAATEPGASPTPVMGVLAGLGAAAVVFGLRRR